MNEGVVNEGVAVYLVAVVVGVVVAVFDCAVVLVDID